MMGAAHRWLTELSEGLRLQQPGDLHKGSRYYSKGLQVSGGK